MRGRQSNMQEEFAPLRHVVYGLMVFALTGVFGLAVYSLGVVPASIGAGLLVWAAWITWARLGEGG